MNNAKEKINENQLIISVIELDFHADCLDGFLKIFENSIHIIHVFTTKKNMNILKEIKYTNNIIFHPYNSFSKFVFLFKNKFIIDLSDVVFINTIASDFGAYLAINKKLNTIVRIHNINKHFNPLNSITFPKNLFSLWKFTSFFFRQLIIKGTPIFRLIINKRIKYFTFPDNGLKEFAISKNYLPKEKIIDSIPLKIFNSSTPIAVFSEKLNICIVGSTDVKRRNYIPIIDDLTEIYSNLNPPKINLTLLGKSKGLASDRIINQFNKINNSNFSITVFNDIVSENKFIEIMNNTHLIISPIIEFSKVDIYTEIYGKTKTSGSILDFMKFGIVTMTPNYYSPPIDLNNFILKYTDSKNLAEQINQFCLNPSFLNTLNQKAKEFSSNNFNKNKILNICESTFYKINEDV